MAQTVSQPAVYANGLKSDKNSGTVLKDTYTVMITFCSVLRMRNDSDKSCREVKTHNLYSIAPPPPKSCHLWDNVNKYYRAGQATDDNMVHVHCMLDNLGYNYTLRINMQYLLLFYGNNGCINMPHRYIIRKVPVFFVVKMSFIRLEVVVSYSFGTSV